MDWLKGLKTPWKRTDVVNKPDIPIYDGGEMSSEELKEKKQKTEAAALIQQSLGKPAGYLKVKAGKQAELKRLSQDVGNNVRHNVGRYAGQSKEKLAAGTVVNYYLVDGKETKNSRYYISLESHVAWVDASVMEKASANEKPNDTAKVNMSINPRTINYKQYDNRWANKKYGRYSTYSVGGCGPTSAANIAVKFGHAEATPETLGDLSVSVGARFSSGTEGDKLFKAAASKYGFSISGAYYSKSLIKQQLEYLKGTSGKYAIVNVKSSKWGNGHFMTLYGYDGKNVYIDDPNTWNEKEDANVFVRDHLYCMWVCG